MEQRKISLQPPNMAHTIEILFAGLFLCPFQMKPILNLYLRSLQIKVPQLPLKTFLKFPFVCNDIFNIL